MRNEYKYEYESEVFSCLHLVKRHGFDSTTNSYLNLFRCNGNGNTRYEPQIASRNCAVDWPPQFGPCAWPQILLSSFSSSCFPGTVESSFLSTLTFVKISLSSFVSCFKEESLNTRRSSSCSQCCLYSWRTPSTRSWIGGNASSYDHDRLPPCLN